MALRFAIVLLVWSLLQLYAGRSLASATRVLRIPAAWGWMLAFTLAVLPVAGMVAYRRELIGIDSAWQWASMMAMGYASILFFATLAGDLVRGTLALKSRVVGPKSPEGRERTRRVADRVAALAALAALALTGAGLLVAWKPVVVEEEIAVRGLDPRLDGLRIALLSDIHVGPLVTGRFASRVAHMTNALQPDMIAIAGDLVDGTPDVLREHVAPLAELRAPSGVFYVTGNHEYYWDPEGWIEEARGLGWTVLSDEHRVVDRDGARFVVAGVNDLRARDMLPSHSGDPVEALSGAPLEPFTILLSHQPQSGRGAEALGVDLQLSGHTHGGQYFPFNLMVYLFQPRVKGLHREGGMQVYITPGTGFWGPPNRLGSRGRITAITLRRSD